MFLPFAFYAQEPSSAVKSSLKYFESCCQKMDEAKASGKDMYNIYTKNIRASENSIKTIEREDPKYNVSSLQQKLETYKMEYGSLTPPGKAPKAETEKPKEAPVDAAPEKPKETEVKEVSESPKKPEIKVEQPKRMTSELVEAEKGTKSRTTSNEPVKDQGIWNDFHRENLNKVVYSYKKIVHNAPDASLKRNSFDLTTPIIARLYLEKSIKNYCAEFESAGTHSVGTWNNNEIKSVKILFKVNGVVKKEGHIAYTTSSETYKEWTTWYYEIIPESPIPWNVGEGFDTKATLRNFFGEFVQKAEPGTYKISYEFYLNGKNKEQSKALAVGEFDLKFNADQKKAWDKNYGEADLFSLPSEGAYQVKILNSGSSKIPFTIVRPGKTSYDNALSPNKDVTAKLNPGDKIIVGGKDIFIAASGTASIDLAKY